MSERVVLVMLAGEGVDEDDAARVHRALLPVMARHDDGEPRLFVAAVDRKLASDLDTTVLLNAMNVAVTEWQAQ